MSKLLIGVADDNQDILKCFENFLLPYKDEWDVITFNSASDVEDYVYDTPGSLQILFLDVHFDDGTNGIDSLPEIKRLDPGLPVVIMTGLDLDDELLANLYEEYQVQYIEKELRPKEIINKIKHCQRLRKDNYSNAKTMIEDYVHAGLMDKVSSMLTVSEALEVTSLIKSINVFFAQLEASNNFKSVNETINSIKLALDSYADALANWNVNDNSSNSILLNAVKNEFSSLFNGLSGLKNVPALIRWCIAHDKLKNALVYFTESLPSYIFHEGVININDNKIVTYCQEKSKRQENNNMSWEKFALQIYSLWDYYGYNNNTFLPHLWKRSLLDPCKNCNKYISNVRREIVSECSRYINCCSGLDDLSSNNILKLIVTRACGNNITPDEYIKREISGGASLEEFLIKEAANLDWYTMIELVLYVEKPDEFQRLRALDKSMTLVGRTRGCIVRQLLVLDIYTSSFGRDLIAGFVDQYCDIVKNYRNNVSHATSNSNGVSDNALILEKISSAIDLIKPVYNE